MRLLFSLILLLIFGSLKAQDPFYRIIDKSEGLPSNTIYDIIQDKKGYIWISHDEGVSKYDGFSFKTYAHPAQTSKPGSSLQEDKYGRIWYSNFDGYLYYIANEKMYPLEMGSPLGFTKFGVGENILYVIEQEGVVFYDLLTLKRSGLYPRKTLSYSSSLMLQNAFILQDSLIYVFKEKQLVQAISYKSIPNFKKGFTFFSERGDNAILASREKTDPYCILFNLENGFKTVPFKHQGFVQNYSQAGRYIWACTPSGVYGFTNTGKLFWGQVKPVFSQFNVSNVFKDKSGNYWFTTLTEGLIFVPDLSARLISPQQYKPYRIHETREEVLIGNRGGQIVSLNKNNTTKLLVSSNNHDITRLLYDSISNHLMFANRFFQITKLNGEVVYFSKTAVKDVVRINDNYIAYASSGRIGLIRLGSNKKADLWDSIFNHATVIDGKECSFLNVSVRGKSVAFNANKSALYFATNIGLYKVSKNGITQVKSNGKSIYAQKIRMAGDKLFFLSGQNILHQILPNDSILIVPTNGTWKNMKISNGHLFLMGDNYLHGLNQSDSFQTITAYDYPAGNYELNDVGYKFNSLYLATNAGLVICPLLPLKQESRKPPFYITSLNIGGRYVPTKEAGVFPFNENEVEINYAILNYQPSGTTPLYYQINEGEWTSCFPQTRTLKLPALSPGKYLIRFRFDNQDVEQEFVSFEINRPYYQQWWYIIFILLILIALSLGYNHLRLKRVQETNRLQMEKIELEKSLGQSMLTAIKSQMNPHFFYNALNTIQSYIFTNEGSKASAYLSKFSKLTRLILEMSEKETVSLDDELRALHLYLELEQGRFDDNDFNFKLEVDKKVEVELIQIPSMLVQPYVENAIKHGLLHKRGKKELFIHFSRAGDVLKIEVTDNGIGRENAGKINAARKEMYHSFATHANQKRLEILNKGRTRSIGIEIEDHINTQGEALGTSVFISIPINGE